MTDTDTRPAATLTPVPAYLRAIVVLLAVVMVACLVIAVSTVVTAYNSSETCRSVSDGGFLGDPAPCW